MLLFHPARIGKMRNYWLKYFLFLVLVSIAGTSMAQSIEFSAKASKSSVAADEAFKLIYTVNTDGAFTAPDLRDFKLLSGPASNSYSQIQIINGQMKNSFTMTYTLVVRPKKEGDFTIPPASVTVNNKIYKSNSIKISVTKATGNSTTDNSTTENGSANPVRGNGKNVFCNISVSKNKLYKGESVLITYKLYTRYSQIQDYDIKLGTQKDVWAQEIPAGKQGWPSYEENIGGIRYVVFPIKKEILFPQKSGQLKLEPFDMMVVARTSFFESNRFDVVSNSPVLEVMPVPSNAPKSFTNAVGKFSLSSTISKEEVSVNDGIDLTLKISGSGNIKLIEPPKFDFPTDFETYDPEISDKTSVNASGTSGSKEYKFLIIPRHSGEYTIKPVDFTYFDLETKNYITVSTPEYKIKVKKGEGEAESGNNAVLQNNVEILDKDIRFLKSPVELKTDHSAFTGSIAYFTLVIATPLFWLILLLYKRNKDKNFDPTATKSKNANKIIVHQLRKAGDLLKQNKKEDFYTELLKGIQQYYCDKYNQKMVDFNRNSILQTLTNKGISASVIDPFLQLIDELEMARYASFSVGNEQNMFNKANELVRQLEGGKA